MAHMSKIFNWLLVLSMGVLASFLYIKGFGLNDLGSRVFKQIHISGQTNDHLGGVLTADSDGLTNHDTIDHDLTNHEIEDHGLTNHKTEDHDRTNNEEAEHDVTAHETGEDIFTNNTVKSKVSKEIKILTNVSNEDKHTTMDNILTQKSRIQTTNSVCKAHPKIRSMKMRSWGIYYSNGPLYYCNVPKLGSTFLKKFFPMRLRSVAEEVKKAGFSRKAFSFLNVGDPYHRLYSAYKDKLFKPDIKFWEHLGRRVEKAVRQNTNKELYEKTGYDLTFRETVQYVITQHENKITLDAHLEPIHKLCNPCKTQFNFIGKTETSSNDLINLFETLKNNGIVKDAISVPTLGNAIVGYKQMIKIGTIQKLFLAIERYPALSAHNLFLRHWSTFHISGYILNQYEMPFNKSDVKTVTITQYERAVKKAMDRSRDKTEQLKDQRHEALVQAYRSIPPELLSRLREFVKPDCMLFGYNDKPDYIFDRATYNDSITHIYMKGL